MKRFPFIVILFALALVPAVLTDTTSPLVASAAPILSGDWLFGAETEDGLLQARLKLHQESELLAAVLWIDNRLLSGYGQTDGTQFDVVMTYADRSGANPDLRVRLKGKLAGDRISGTFDNGTDSGNWTGERVSVEKPRTTPGSTPRRSRRLVYALAVTPRFSPTESKSSHVNLRSQSGIR